MCIAVISTEHSEYPFILINNRDEFIARPTANANWWDPPNEQVLGGRDLQKKERGTWLAITKQGRIAVLTNFREDGEKAENKSRGAIVNAYLTSPLDQREDPETFARRLIDDVGVHDVGGFSLLFGELRAEKNGSFPGLSILSNRSKSVESLTHIASKPGETHGLSNSHFEDKSWTKVVRGEILVHDAIRMSADKESSKEKLIDSLFAILNDSKMEKRKPDEDFETYKNQMRNSILIPTASELTNTDRFKNIDPAKYVKAASTTNGTSTPDHTNAEHAMGDYGTQKQTVIVVDKRGNVTFVERNRFDEHGNRIPGVKPASERKFEFQIEGWTDDC